MTRYVILEDERLAYDELKRMTTRLRPGYTLAGWAASVEQAVPLLSQPGLDLAIADIRLADGLSFDAFSASGADVPIIFTTAYDEHALRAFNFNSISYLLKPFEDEQLEAALCKFERNALTRPSSQSYARMAEDYAAHAGGRTRFLVRLGDEYRTVSVADTLMFYSEDKATLVLTTGGKSYILDHTLDGVEAMLDTRRFFRLSRGVIASIESIAKVNRYFGGRLRVTLTNGQAVTTSRARTAPFLSWFGGEK